MAVTLGTWNPTNPLAKLATTLDFGLTEKYAPWLGVNPNQPAVNSGGASASYDTPAPTPAPTTPIVKSNTPVATTTPPVQSSGPTIDQQINSELENTYNQQNGLINSAENLLGQTRDTSLSGLANQQSQIETSQKSAYEEAMRMSQKQTATTEDTRQRALSDNVRSLNNLSQQILSRFGMGSNTGGSMTEIATQKFFSVQGDIFAKAMASFDIVNQGVQQALQTYNLGKQKLIDDIGQAKKIIFDDYATKLFQLESQRVDIAGARSQGKMDLLNQAKTRIQSLADSAQLQAERLDGYLAQVQAEATGSTQTIRNLIEKYNSQSNAYNNSIYGMGNTNFLANSGTQSQLPQTTYNPYYDNTKDTYDSLNPFQ